MEDDSLVAIIEGKDFDPKVFNHHGPCSKSKDFILYYIKSPVNLKRQMKLFICLHKDHFSNPCNQSFIGILKFFMHLRTHTGEQPYRCDQCGKKFTQLSSLKMHQNIHLGIKNIECERCGKRFNKRYNLQVHQRSKTGCLRHLSDLEQSD